MPNIFRSFSWSAHTQAHKWWVRKCSYKKYFWHSYRKHRPELALFFFQITEYSFGYTTSTDINDSSTYSPSRAAMSDTFDTFMDLTISYKCHWASYGFCVSNISTSENVFFSQKFSLEAQLKWLRQNLESYLWGQKGWIIIDVLWQSEVWKTSFHLIFRSVQTVWN